jgi:hypothetical protein
VSAGFNRPGLRVLSGTVDNELSIFHNRRTLRGYGELTYSGDDLILSGNLVVSGSISSSGHTTDGTSAINVGSGAGLFYQKVGNELQFKSIVAGDNITINNNTNSIEISSSGGGGGGTPGGSTTQIQYNDGGSFNGSSLLTFNNGTNLITTPDTTISGTLTLSGSIIPLNNTSYNLGSPTKRFSNVYTGDLHLKNERGDWTLYEERDMLVVVNNITGKRFRLNLIPLD